MSYPYCLYCQTLPNDNLHRIHHDTDYGTATDDDNILFGKLILEINQAGLSWNTILLKEANFREAYSQYDIHQVAQYGEDDIARLLANPGIIRNRLKVHAVIYNANQILQIKDSHGSFFQWIKMQEAETITDWVKIFKKQFKFVGGEICNEFLMTIGRIGESHHPECYRYGDYMAQKRIWNQY